jgi:hypothetical protein
MVVIDPDIADLFPNEASVNDALRSLAEIAKRASSPRRRTGRSAGSGHAWLKPRSEGQ